MNHNSFSCNCRPRSHTKNQHSITSIDHIPSIPFSYDTRKKITATTLPVSSLCFNKANHSLRASTLYQQYHFNHLRHHRQQICRLATAAASATTALGHSGLCASRGRTTVAVVTHKELTAHWDLSTPPSI